MGLWRVPGLNLSGKKKRKKITHQRRRFEWSLTKKRKREREREQLFIHVLIGVRYLYLIVLVLNYCWSVLKCRLILSIFKLKYSEWRLVINIFSRDLANLAFWPTCHSIQIILFLSIHYSTCCSLFWWLFVMGWLCSVYGEAIPVKELAERVASYVHLCTLYWWLRFSKYLMTLLVIYLIIFSPFKWSLCAFSFFFFMRIITDDADLLDVE